MSARTRRQFLKTVSLGAALISSSLGRSAVQAESTAVAVYTGLHQSVSTPLVEAFEAETGLRVDLIAGGTGDIMARLRAEAANPRADVVLAIGGDALEGSGEFFEPYASLHDEAILPPLISSAHWRPHGVLTQAFLVNTDLLSEEEMPSNWPDLADPGWRGRIAYPGADKSGAAFVMLATILHIYGEDEGWALFERMFENFVITNSSGRVGRGTADGEYAVGLTVESVGREYVIGGAPIRIVYPDPTAAMPNGVALVKGGPNPEGGRRFLDFALSKPGQQVIIDLGRRGVRSDMAPPSGLPPMSQLTVDNYELSWASENRDTIIGRYLDLVRR